MTSRLSEWPPKPKKRKRSFFVVLKKLTFRQNWNGGCDVHTWIKNIRKGKSFQTHITPRTFANKLLIKLLDTIPSVEWHNSTHTVSTLELNTSHYSKCPKLQLMWDGTINCLYFIIYWACTTHQFFQILGCIHLPFCLLPFVALGLSTTMIKTHAWCSKWESSTFCCTRRFIFTLTTSQQKFHTVTQRGSNWVASSDVKVQTFE